MLSTVIKPSCFRRSNLISDKMVYFFQFLVNFLNRSLSIMEVLWLRWLGKTVSLLRVIGVLEYSCRQSLLISRGFIKYMTSFLLDFLAWLLILKHCNV